MLMLGSLFPRLGISSLEQWKIRLSAYLQKEDKEIVSRILTH